jgi:hypothetical protein
MTPPAKRSLRPIPGILPVVLSLVALVVLLVGLATVFRSAPSSVMAAPHAVDTCRTSPQFVASVAPAAHLALATDGREMGLALRAVDGATTYQHPTWDDAGYLGAIAYDAQGNVYAAPTPRLSLVDNPLLGAATLWRADTATGELRPFVTLPGEASARNPFGVLGLFYACDLDTLYAGSVLGSLPTEEHGGVVAISLPDGAQTAILSNTDVMGVLVVRQGAGYTLYAGLARRPAIIALTLDAQGHPVGTPVTMLDLTLAGATPQERARKLRLIGDQLVIELIPFTFSLQANATNIPQVRRAVWGWDMDVGQWTLRQSAQSTAS